MNQKCNETARDGRTVVYAAEYTDTALPDRVLS